MATRTETMRRLLPALLLLTTAALRAQSSCPTTAPSGAFIVTNNCGPTALCLAGTSVQLTLMPIIPDCPAPPPGAPPSCGQIYQIQPCDRVTWTFGDGTAAVTFIGGSPISISHLYAAAGSYRPSVTISNALGSVQAVVANPVVIASNPPTYVEFSQLETTVPETIGSITFTLIRSGNLSTTSTVHYAHAEGSNQPVNQGEAIGGNVTFAPGETTKSFTMHVYDDHAYGGPVTDYLFATATDGTLFRADSQLSDRAVARYTLTETDPQPTASVADVRVSESAGTADFVISLSAPMGVWVSIFGATADGTAKNGSDYRDQFATAIEPGATQVVLRVPIVNDDVPEPDETFTVTVKTFAAVGPKFTRSTATCTIVNDDAAITPASMQIATGARVSLKVDVGQPETSPLTVPLQSSSPEVLGVPASVTIEAAQSSANFTAHALQAGRSRITATIPGMTVPPALITVVDSVTVVAEPAAVALRPGGNATINVSIQPPRSVAQTVSVRSTRPEVVAVPESLTIPAGGKATLDVHAVASGVATIWIATADGFSFSVDVTVAEGAVVVTRIEPPNASASGGSSVTLIGEGLDARCSVSFGSAPATAVAAVSNGLNVVVPPHAAGVVDVNVVCPSSRLTLPDAFTFFLPRRRAAG